MWRDMVHEALGEYGEGPEDILAIAGNLDVSLDALGIPRFTVWTHKRVYFPVMYDGDYSAGSAPRNPCSEQVSAFGG